MAQNAEAELTAGQIIGSFRIVQKIGQGGMGAVYEAEHTFTKMQAALKVMHAYRNDEDYKSRMVQEVRALAKLKHNNVVRLLDANVTPEGDVWMAMEFLEGVTLREVMLRDKDMPVSTALDYLIQACDGAGAVHELSIVHRDLKPENIFLARPPGAGESHGQHGTIKILDFGAAKAPELGVRRSTDVLLFEGGQRRVLGTPQYMSPEHLNGRSVDERTDVYALGIMGYEMLLRHPLANDDGTLPHILELVRRQLEIIAPPLHQVSSRIPMDLSLVIQRAMEKDPALRWANASELAAALRACNTHLFPGASSSTDPMPPARVSTPGLVPGRASSPELVPPMARPSAPELAPEHVPPVSRGRTDPLPPPLKPGPPAPGDSPQHSTSSAVVTPARPQPGSPPAAPKSRWGVVGLFAVISLVVVGLATRTFLKSSASEAPAPAQSTLSSPATAEAPPAPAPPASNTASPSASASTEPAPATSESGGTASLPKEAPSSSVAVTTAAQPSASAPHPVTSGTRPVAATKPKASAQPTSTGLDGLLFDKKPTKR